MSANDLITTDENICNSLMTPTDQTEQQSCDTESESTETIYSQLKQISLNHGNNLKIGSVNVNSIRNKFENIHIILSNLLLDCMFINESKLDDSFPSNLYNVSNYTLYRNDRTSHAGGIMSYIRSDIPHSRLPDYEISLDFVESLAFKLVINKENWLLLGIYRSPCSDITVFIPSLTKILELAQTSFKQIIIIGDLNFNLTQKTPLHDVCDQFSLKNVIKGFTCYKNVNNPSLIDVCLVNNSRRFVKSFNLLQDSGFSDFHSLIRVITKLHFYIFKPRDIIYRSMKNFNQVEFDSALNLAPFHVMHVFEDSDDKAWFFHQLYISVIDEIAPLKKRRIKYKQLPYMNSELRKAMFKRNMLRNNFYKIPNHDRNSKNKAWEAFRSQRNLVTSLRRKSLKLFFEKRSMAAKSDPKSYYSAISPFMSSKSKAQCTDIQLNINDDLISDPVQVCEHFNSSFDIAVSNMGLKENLDQNIGNIIETYKDHPSVLFIRNEIMKDKSCSFSFDNIESSKFKSAITTLKANKAAGYDKIPSSIIKSSSVINNHILTVYNSALQQSKFPQCFKPAEISPIYKKGDRLSIKNYRPINILTSISKPFETLIAQQITSYFVQNDIIHELISAYRKGFGTNQTLLKMVEDWKKSLDNGNHVGVVASDQSKAFDTLPPGLHVAKLYAYGFSIDACEFIFNYLTNRPHRTKLGPHTSSWQYQEKGVAQGSGLGPLLYNLHCNDLPYFMKTCQFYNYADDNTISYASKNTTDIVFHLKAEINLLLGWFESNGFQANPNKFQYMLVSRNNFHSEQELSIDQEIILKPTNEMKILGVIIDNNLTFGPHVHAICRKANKSINALKRLTILPPAYKVDIVRTYINTHFSYCDIVYNFCGKVLSDKIEKIQERALRFAYTDYNNTYSSLLIKFNQPSLLCKRIISILKEAHKSYHNTNPTTTRHLFTVKPITQHNTRQSHDLHLPRFNTITYGKRSISYLGPKLFNIQNTNIREMPLICFLDFLKHNFIITDNMINQHNLTIH